MISNYVQNAIEDSDQVFNYMEGEMNFPYKDVIKGIQKNLNFDQRKVERCIKTTTGYTPKAYFDKRKATIAIDEIVSNPNNINKIYKKYNGKKKLNEICKKYFGAEIYEIIKNRDEYILQDKIDKEFLESRIEIIEDTIRIIKLSRLGKVTRKENIYKIEKTLDRMPIYAIPEFKLSELNYQYKYNKINVQQFFGKIVALDRIIRNMPKGNVIELTEAENAIVEFCYPIYNLFDPINIDGICYFGPDENIIYRYLKNKGLAKKTQRGKKDRIENTIVRYLGNSVSMEIDDEDSICYYFFTKDMNSDLDKCKVDYYIDISKNELNQIIERVYNKYKDKYKYLKGLKEEQLSLEEKELLNKKIDNFRYGETMIISLVGDEVVAINDFYPKAVMIDNQELISLISNIIAKVECIYNKGINVEDNIMASGYEIINKIIRSCMSIGEGEYKDIGKYMNINFKEFDKLEDLFVDLTYLYVLYITNKLNEEELILKSNDIFENIYKYMPMLKELYQVAKCEK